MWSYRKIGHGQPRVIIWTNLVILMHPMLHTNFEGHRPFGSGEEDCLRFLPYMGMAAILVVWPRRFEQTFVPPSHGGSTWNFASIGLVVSKEIFENVDNTHTHTHIRTHTHTYIHTYIHTNGRHRPTYPISSPMILRLRWAKKVRGIASMLFFAFLTYTGRHELV